MTILTPLRAPPSPTPCLWIPSTSSNLLSFSRPNSFLAYIAECTPRISNGFRSFVHARSSKSTADVDKAVEEKTHAVKLKQKMEALGINSDSCTPGQYDLLYCPMVYICFMLYILAFGGEQNGRISLLGVDLSVVLCGWAGKVFADTRKAYPGVKLHEKISRPLETLGDELLKYFAERMISKGTLQRNNVMQVAGDKNIIAFTYRRNGQFVGCKYRTIEKKFWQEKNTEKMFYGLDDIAEADEIIIVEGELDKLSLEEAGYYNCISVPDGAPQTVSLGRPPSLEKDTRFQYLWNCKHYLDKVKRIILATDSDVPGQALAEELARRLGRERCWQVRWPKKYEGSSFKDANEVLNNLGADGLRDAIGKAELYQMQNLT